MPGVTISAGYGAGGSAIAPLVAERLTLPMLDRAISSAVAEQLQVTTEEAHDAKLRQSRVDRIFSLLAPISGGLLGTEGAALDAVTVKDAALFRDRADEIMRSALATGAVILGRGGAAAFRDRPDVLRVRLFGAVPGRLVQGAAIEGVDVATAKQRQPRVDEARRQYVRRLYHVDIDDPALYDLQLDTTRVPAATCAELIATAYRALGRP